jgi:hypothetical protein
LIDTIVQEHIDKELKKDYLPADAIKLKQRVLGEIENRYKDWFEESISLTEASKVIDLTPSLDLDENEDEDLYEDDDE